MKIWSRTLTRGDLFECAVEVNADHLGCTVYLARECELYEGPRTRRLDHVHLRSLNGRYHPNPGTSRDRSVDGMAASWAEWGWFILNVFQRDAEARCGQYKSLTDFHEQTHALFMDPRTPRERQIQREIQRELRRVA